MKVHYLEGYMLDLQAKEKEIDDAPPRGTPPGFTPNKSKRTTQYTLHKKNVLPQSICFCLIKQLSLERFCNEFVQRKKFRF